MMTHHFKEIDEYMKEYWKTHKAIPPYEDDPPCIVARIVKKENEDDGLNLININAYFNN